MPRTGQKSRNRSKTYDYALNGRCCALVAVPFEFGGRRKRAPSRVMRHRHSCLCERPSLMNQAPAEVPVPQTLWSFLVSTCPARSAAHNDMGFLLWSVFHGVVGRNLKELRALLDINHAHGVLPGSGIVSAGEQRDA